jgi:hypothetical protein
MNSAYTTYKANTYKATPILMVMLLVGSQPLKAIEDFDNFWVSPTAITASNTSKSGTFQVQSSWVNKLADRSSQLLHRDSVISTFASTSNGFNTLAFASSYSEEESSAAIGIQLGALSFYVNSGSGESYSHNNTNYSGIDPFAYHGGNIVDYQYTGASMGFAIGKYSQLQAGQTTVTADRLEDRRSSFIDFSNNRMFARYTYVERGNDYVGYGLDAGVKIGRINLAYQELTNNYDVSTRRVRFNWKQDQRNSFWLDLSAHRNAALEAYSDSSIMISWQHSIGVNNLASHATDEEADKPKQRGGLGRGVLIGGAVAAGAVVLSSGSGGQDSAERVAPAVTQSNPAPTIEPTPQADNSQTTEADQPNVATAGNPQHESARSRFNSINPISVAENREYGGYVYQAADGSFATTNPIAGDATSVELPEARFGVPNGTIARASYHTHAAFDPEFASEEFSDTDLEGDRFDNIDGYLATPMGAFLYHEVTSGQISRIGTVNN